MLKITFAWSKLGFGQQNKSNLQIKIVHQQSIFNMKKPNDNSNIFLLLLLLLNITLVKNCHFFQKCIQMPKFNCRLEKTITLLLIRNLISNLIEKGKKIEGKSNNPLKKLQVSTQTISNKKFRQIQKLPRFIQGPETGPDRGVI